LNPTTEHPIFINSTVVDDSGVQSVNLYYRTNGGSWEMNLMILTKNSIYQVIFSDVFDKNDHVQYYFKAIDDSVNHYISISDNNGLFYGFIISKPSFGISAFGFLTFILVLPTITLLTRKRRK